ncbi:MAG: heparinase II/III family protein [Caulobacteraceae bacterium]
MARLPAWTPDLAALTARWRDRIPLSDRRAERLGLEAVAARKALQDQLRAEWAGSPPHLWLISRPRPEGLAAAPAEPRPPRARRGKAIAAGRFVFDGLVLETGPGGDPWNRPSPSRAFAEALHGMDWLPDLLAQEGGARPALALVRGWIQVFGRWNAFSWSPGVLERRVHNLACGLQPLLAEAGRADAALLDTLARQARHLLLAGGDETRRAERAAAGALAGAVLAGRAGEQLMGQGLARLEQALPETVLPDGGHASRAPEAGLELLFDLKALDQALHLRGRPSLPELSRAIDRLASTVRRLTLADGRLAALQGGEESDPTRIAAAVGEAPEASSTQSLPHAGYEFLSGGQLLMVVDTGAPASGAWSASACAQPLAIEVTAGADRLITSSAWSPRAAAAQALRLTPAASTASVSDLSCGEPLQGWLAKVLGFRLQGGCRAVVVRRHDGADASWLELSHDGWAEAFGLRHERRLYLERATEELRGEDQLVPVDETGPRPQRRPPVLVVRFQLHPEVKASVALDHKSVLLQPRGAAGGAGWWLRNDAAEISLEPAVRLEDGRPRATFQVVLRAPLRPDGGARIRWKLTHADRPPASGETQGLLGAQPGRRTTAKRRAE